MKVAVEPGLLSLLRVFVVLQAGTLLFIIFCFAAEAEPRHPIAIMGLMLGATVPLVPYLYSRAVQARLGAFYLPLALAVMVVVPFVGELVAQRCGVPDYHRLVMELSVSLLLPILAVSWQYELWVVVLLALGMWLLDLLLGTMALSYGTPAGTELSHFLFGRSVAFIALGFIITRLVAEQRAQRRALEHANAELRLYAVTREHLAEVRERNRISRELHDTLAHSLSATAVQLEAARTLFESDAATARTMVDKALAATRAGLGETRRALQALRASPIEDFGLGGALERLADDAAARAGFAASVRMPAAIPLDLPLETQQALYRVAQEALENVVRHAQARHVAVEVALDEAAPLLTLTITDDGRGFEPAEVSAGTGHHGLTGMRERAALLAGSLVIDASAGRGTSVRFAVPVLGRAPLGGGVEVRS